MKITVCRSLLPILAGGLFLIAGMTTAQENLYPNPDFKGVVNSRGVWAMRNLWYRGSIAPDGEYKGKTAIKVEAVKVDWGGFDSCVACDHLKLEPGKYSFSVWCRTEEKKGMISLVFIRYENGKRVQTAKKYIGNDMPEPGKWTELIGDFEVKADMEKVFFTMGYYGKEPGTVWFSTPKLVRNQED